MIQVRCSLIDVVTLRPICWGIDCFGETSSQGAYGHKKTTRPCVEPQGLSSGQSHVRQSFSRFRLIAPRLTLQSGRLSGRA